MTTLKDCVEYTILNNGDLMVKIIDNSAYELLVVGESDLNNFYFITDLEKELGGLYFITQDSYTKEIGTTFDQPIFLESWTSTPDGRFFYAWRIWGYTNFKEKTPLIEILSQGYVVFERIDCVTDIENIKEVAVDLGYILSHEDTYNIYNLFQSLKNEPQYKAYTLYELISAMIVKYFK